MTTWEYAHVRGRGILARLAEKLKPAAKTLRAGLGRMWDKVRPVAMTALGLGCITAGMFTISLLWGLIAAGVSFFVVDWVGK